MSAFDFKIYTGNVYLCLYCAENPTLGIPDDIFHLIKDSPFLTANPLWCLKTMTFP